MITFTEGKRGRGTRVFAMVAAALALASAASAATVTNQPGSVCKNLVQADATFMRYETNGIRSTKTQPTYILCPTARTLPSLGGGAEIYVDVNHSGYRTTTCTAYSYAAGGRLLGSRTASWFGISYGYVYLNLRGTGLSDITSDYSVVCTIDGSGQALISGVHVKE